MELRMKLIIIGDTEISALLTKIENGLIAESDKVAIGAKADKTINPKASAPPNNPNLQRISTTGATINENPTPKAASSIFGSKNSKIPETTPKIIHIKSDISRLRISIMVAETNMIRASRILM